MHRWAIDAAAFALVLALLQGCGSSSNPATPPDASTDSATDAGKPDVTAEAASDASDAGVDSAPPDCGSVPPNGKQIVASTDQLVILGQTQDGYAVYEDLQTQVIFGVSVTGGPAEKIGPMTSQGGTFLATGGVAVLYLPKATDPTTTVAPLSIWSSAGGMHVISTTALAQDSYYYTYDVSLDGEYVAYFVTTDGVTATLTASTGDGKTQTPLVPSIDLTQQSCPPSVQFVGHTVIAQYCLTPEPSTVASTIAAFAAPSFAQVTLGTMFAPTVGPNQVDPTGKLVLLTPPAGGLAIYPIEGADGGAPTPTIVDPNGASGGFLASGDVLYTSSSTALLRYSATTHMATTLVTGGLNFLLSVSPDGNWVQAGATEDSTTEETDLYLASTTTPGPAIPVVTTATTIAYGFSTDSSYSTFGTNFPTESAGSYDFEASKSSSGSASKVLAAVTAPHFTSGSKLVAGINLTPTTGGVDVVALDLSTTARPTTLVTQADPNVLVTAKLDVVYSWYCDETSMAGIWTVPAP